MEKQIKILRELDASIAQQKSVVGNNFRRLRMLPSYSAWRATGTRPSSDRGVTFHFRHSFVSKRRHFSESWQDVTTAARHQSYIERFSAVEKQEAPDSDLEVGGGGNISPSLNISKKRRRPFIPAENLGLVYPPPYRESGLLSFGTIGLTKSERVEFWRRVERAEGGRGRVQCRIILELPHEVGQSVRFKIAREFTRIFEERGLPYWCSIHAPSKHNDPRNWHMHIVYYDRPARRAADGRWDFEIDESYTTTSGSVLLYYPHRQNKDRGAQGRAWIHFLRQRYAEIANDHLARAGVDKRYDPRPYRESGILKQATRHLGTKVSILETYGIETRLGSENLRREVNFRLSRPELLLRSRLARADAFERRIFGLFRMAPALFSEENEEARVLISVVRHSSQEEARYRKDEEAHKIAAESVLLRLDQRMKFIDQEADRLLLMKKKRQFSSSEAEEVWSDLLRERQQALTVRQEMEEYASEALARAESAGKQAEAAGQIVDKAISSLLELESRAIAKIGKWKGAPDEWIDDVRSAVYIADAIVKYTAKSLLEGRDLEANVGDGVGDFSIHKTGDVLLTSTAIKTSGVAAFSEKKSDFIEGRASDKISSIVEAYSALEPDKISSFTEAYSAPDSAPEPEKAALLALFGEEPKKLALRRGDPDAFILSPKPTVFEIQSLQAEVRLLNNQELRRRAKATLDSALLAEDSTERLGYIAAWHGLREIARRRGLDLETGKYDPQKAVDSTGAINYAKGSSYEEPLREQAAILSRIE